MVKLADTPDLGSGAFVCAGSSPVARTIRLVVSDLPKEDGNFFLLNALFFDSTAGASDSKHKIRLSFRIKTVTKHSTMRDQCYL